MKTSKLFLLLIFFLNAQLFFAQNYVTYSNLSQTVSTNSGTEVSVTVVASCYGSSQNSILITPTYCVFDSGLTSISYSNGTYLLPSQTSTITFKFKKTVSVDSNFTYKFSTNSSCSQPDSNQIKITVQYKYVALPTTICNLPIVTGVQAQTTSNSLVIKWNKVPNALSYSIGCREIINLSSSIYGNTIVADPSFFDSMSSLGTCSQTIFGLTPGKLYEYFIRAECVTNPLDYGSHNWFYGSISTLPPCVPDSPINLNAVGVSGSSSYIITFTTVPNIDQYTMEYYDLSVNLPYSGGTQNIISPDIYNVILTAIPLNHTFKFRIKANNICNDGAFSEWKTIVPSNSSQCDLSNYPSNLILTSGCSYPGSVCGTGNFQWTPVVGAVSYEVQYTILNYTSAVPQPINGTFQSTNSTCSWWNMYANYSLAPWRINFRVKSKCADGSWSDFSPWSANFAW